MSKDKIDLLLQEKMKLLTKVNALLEEVLNETDDKVRIATDELVRQLKSNISEIDEKISLLEQTEDEAGSGNDEVYEGEDNKIESEQEDGVDEPETLDDEDEYEYKEEPDVSIGRTDDGTLLAVYDKMVKKQK